MILLSMTDTLNRLKGYYHTLAVSICCFPVFQPIRRTLSTAVLFGGVLWGQKNDPGQTVTVVPGFAFLVPQHPEITQPETEKGKEGTHETENTLAPSEGAGIGADHFEAPGLHAQCLADPSPEIGEEKESGQKKQAGQQRIVVQCTGFRQGLHLFAAVHRIEDPEVNQSGDEPDSHAKKKVVQHGGKATPQRCIDGLVGRCGRNLLGQGYKAAILYS